MASKREDYRDYVKSLSDANLISLKRAVSVESRNRGLSRANPDFWKNSSNFINKKTDLNETDALLMKPLSKNIDEISFRQYLETFGKLVSFDVTTKGFFIPKYENHDTAQFAFNSIKNDNFAVTLNGTETKFSCRLIKKRENDPVV
jgi:hypothetical protein